jgi:hypothetical protein
LSGSKGAACHANEATTVLIDRRRLSFHGDVSLFEPGSAPIGSTACEV